MPALTRPETARPRRRVRTLAVAPATLLAAWLVALLMPLLMAGCAALPAPPPVAPLLHDDLFGQPERPPEAAQVFALSAPMRAHLQALQQVSRSPADLPRALAESLYRPGALRLDYDASTTLNAAQAFDARAGNCLSLVVMTAAMAQALDLPVDFQRVPGGEQLRRETDLTLRTGHVNLVLGARRARPLLGGGPGGIVGPRLLIDFLPPELARGLPAEPIDTPRVLAMFMNNRAVEALLAQQPAQAYAWAREALWQDGGFWPAYNTLGVVYQRAGHLDAAAAAFEHLLAQDDQQVAAMANLAQVRQAQGRDAEAARWTQRRLALEPYPPFHLLRLGQAALAAGDAAQARRLFNRELQLHGASHEVYFELARAHLAAGDPGRAEQALQQAQAFSATAVQQARYAGKLAALRARAMP